MNYFSPIPWISPCKSQKTSTPSIRKQREGLTAVEGLKVSEVALEVTEAWFIWVPNSDSLGLLNWWFIVNRFKLKHTVFPQTVYCWTVRGSWCFLKVSALVLDGVSAFPRVFSALVSHRLPDMCACVRWPRSSLSPVVSPRVCLCVRWWVRLPEAFLPCLPACWTFLPACLPACLRACLRACLPACLSSGFPLWRVVSFCIFP